MTSIFRLTAIDIPGARRITDGVFVNPETFEVNIGVVVPVFSQSSSAKVQEALRNQTPRGPGSHFFDPFDSSIKKNAPTKIFVYSSSPPNKSTRIRLGWGLVAQKYSFDEFTDAIEDLQARLIRGYTDSQGKQGAPSKEIITFLVGQVNAAAADMFKAENIPFLGYQSEKVVVSRGQPTINRPNQNAVSAINAEQLDAWLSNQPLPFSLSQLEELLKK